MNTRQPSLMEILNPPCFPGNAKRAQATRTIQQPEIDRIEQAEAAAMATCRGDGAATSASSRASRGTA